MVIYLMRHTAVDVPQGVCYGQTDVPLKPTFETEATQTAANLQGLSFDKVYTSPLTRCVRLATFCGYPDAERDDRLKELNFGDWEMQYFNNYAVIKDGITAQFGELDAVYLDALCEEIYGLIFDA